MPCSVVKLLKILGRISRLPWHMRCKTDLRVSERSRTSYPRRACSWPWLRTISCPSWC